MTLHNAVKIQSSTSLAPWESWANEKTLLRFEIEPWAMTITLIQAINLFFSACPLHYIQISCKIMLVCWKVRVLFPFGILPHSLVREPSNIANLRSSLQQKTSQLKHLCIRLHVWPVQQHSRLAHRRREESVGFDMILASHRACWATISILCTCNHSYWNWATSNFKTRDWPAFVSGFFSWRVF